MPLHTACANGHEACARLLVEHGANVNASDIDGGTPLWLACEYGNASIVQLLVDGGADVNKAAASGKRPQRSACRHRFEGSPRPVVSMDAYVDEARKCEKTTSLWIACDRGHEECVRLLLDRGARVNKPNSAGATPLWIACCSGYAACARLLVKRGANVNTSDRRADMTALWIACNRGHDECVKLLLHRGARADRAEITGVTPLWTACYNGHEACARLLIGHGADVNPVFEGPEEDEDDDYVDADDLGKTPLVVAYEHGHVECVRTLLRHGAEVKSALDDFDHIFDGYGNFACKVALVEHGAGWDEVDLEDAGGSVEAAVAVGANQFVSWAEFVSMPREELRAIMWRSPSLKTISTDRNVSLDAAAVDPRSVTRKSDGLAVRPALQAGDRVRICRTDGDWEVARVMGDYVELEGREGAVPIRHVVFAGPGHIAWHEANAAEARGQSNIITQVLSRRGRISVRVRALVTDFLSTNPSAQRW